jgi:hypothetical protein
MQQRASLTSGGRRRELEIVPHASWRIPTSCVCRTRCVGPSHSALRSEAAGITYQRALGLWTGPRPLAPPPGPGAPLSAPRARRARGAVSLPGVVGGERGVGGRVVRQGSGTVAWAGMVGHDRVRWAVLKKCEFGGLGNVPWHGGCLDTLPAALKPCRARADTFRESDVERKSFALPKNDNVNLMQFRFQKVRLALVP